MFIYLREEGNYLVYVMCSWARVSRSGYYRWRSQGLSETQKRREELTILITYFFEESEQTYGYRCIHARLQGDRYIVDTVFDSAKLIAGVGKKQKKVVITRVNRSK